MGWKPPPKVLRVKKTRVHIRVLSEKCTGCGRCVELCPSGSWKLEKGKAVWDGMELCLECAACYHFCPEEAICWRYPEGGEGVIYKV